MKLPHWLNLLIGSLGQLKASDCLERGCDKYHGTSPSNEMLFVFGKWRNENDRTITG